MKTIVLNENDINQIDLYPIYKKINTEGKWAAGWDKFLHAKCGDWHGHYKLLAYLSTFFNNGDTLIDIGTLTGASSLALSYNSECKVYSFDLPVETHHTGRVGEEVFTVDSEDSKRVKHSIKNIEYIIGNCLNYKNILLSSSMIFIDIDHSGIEEEKILNFLIKNNWAGIVIMDDIYFPVMKILWDSIKLEKFNIDKYGNGRDGTGLINFSHNYRIVLE